MKSIYVFLIALATGLIGTGIGLFLGGRFGGTLGLAGGSVYGVCVTIETAKELELLTQAQTTQLLEQIEARASSDFKLTPEQIEAFAQINCAEKMREVKQSSQE